jgi:hypothetical protein
MGLWDDFVSGVSGLFSTAGTAAVDTGTNFLSSYDFSNLGGGAPSYGSPAPSYAPAMNVSSPYTQYIAPYVGGGMVAGAGMVARIGSRFAAKFPNLAIAISGFRAAGKNVTRSQLYSLLKRFGPDFLIAGGILSAAAISELMMAGPGRRRMNAGNVKALRRAHRRMKSFHHICATNDTLLRGRKRRSAPANFGGTRITQVK